MPERPIEFEATQIKDCQGCGSKNLYRFLNFGPQPPPNVYRHEEDVLKFGQVSIPLSASVCTNCSLVQLDVFVPAHALFPNNYAYNTPEAMRPDFEQSAKETALRSGAESPKVLEIGSNTGICLQEYRALGMQVLGVDPAEECAQQANQSGIETIVAPFTPELADEIVRERGKMDIVTAANVLQHIPDLRGTIDGIQRVLAPNGIFTLEFPYLGNILKNTDYDTFYAEHYYYLSLTALQNLLQSFRLTIVDAKELPDIHCGSMRIFVKHSPHSMADNALRIISKEKEEGFSSPERWDRFRRRAIDNLYQILQHLYVANARDEVVVAHGASAKFVTLTNFGHIGPEDIKYVADSTRAKHGKVTPGMGIPVVPEEKMFEDAKKIALLFNGIRNFEKQNQPKYDKLKETNPKLKILYPIPEVTYK